MLPLSEGQNGPLSPKLLLPPNNLGLYRLKNFVGRTDELERLRRWLADRPVIAITGPSGAGKSTLATALAVEQATRFEEGILWISATGDTAFNFYDVVRVVEDVLATGITNQPVSTWPLLVLQQLYGFNRLVVLDELTDADPDTVDKIQAMIRMIGPGGQGRFVLIGRSIPQPLLRAVGDARLHLGGLTLTDVQAWIEQNRADYPLGPEDAPLLHQLTGGHPLVLRMVASLWHSPDWGQLIDLISVQHPDDWDARMKAIVSATLAFMQKMHPHANRLLTRCCQASGGFSVDAAAHLFWENRHPDTTLPDITRQLTRLGVLMHNPQQNRFYIHPLLQRYLSIASYPGFPPHLQRHYTLEHARYYLSVAQQYSRTPPHRWPAIDGDWGNIRKAFNFLQESLEERLERTAEEALLHFDSGDIPLLPASMDDILILLRNYALALRGYLIWRHPPEGRRWAAAGIIAARLLTDRRAEALTGLTLASLAYFHHEYATARLWFRRSLPFFRQAGDFFPVVQILKNLGMVERAMDNLEGAFQHYAEALALATQHHFVLEQSILQSLIGSLHYAQKHYEQAIEWHRKALHSLKTADHSRQSLAWQAVHYNNLGLALEAGGHYQEAIEAYNQAIPLHRQVNNKRGLSTTYGNLGAAHYQHGQLQKALKWYRRDMAIRDSLGNRLDQAAILHNMGHIALELDNLPAAADYFTRSRDLYRQFGQNDLAEEEQILLDAIRDRRVVVG